MPSFVRSAAPGRPGFARLPLALAVAVVPFTGACYKYLPAQVEPAPPVGEQVRLVVTRDGAVELSQVTDLANAVVPRIEGRLESTEATSFMIRVRQRNDAAPPGFGTNIGQLVRVPTSQIIGIERRELDVPMTVMTFGGIAAGGTLLLLKIIDAVGSDNSQDVVDPSLSVSVPFSFGIGRSP